MNRSVREARISINSAQNILRREDIGEMEAVAEAQRIAEQATANLQQSESAAQSATTMALRTLQASLGGAGEQVAAPSTRDTTGGGPEPAPPAQGSSEA